LRYGARREPFYPEYYLALAMLNQNRPAEAATLFTRVQQEKLVAPDAPEFAQVAVNLQKAQAAEAARVARVNTSPMPPEPNAPRDRSQPAPVDTATKNDTAAPPIAPPPINQPVNPSPVE